jgi:hypothetical protein
MIFRKNIKCKICSELYTLRIGIGHLEKTKYNFLCYSCSACLSFYMICNFVETNAHLEVAENVETLEFSDNVYNIINFNPNFLISEKDMKSENYNPLNQLHLVSEAIKPYIEIYFSQKIIDFFYIFSFGFDIQKEFFEREKVYNISKVNLKAALPIYRKNKNVTKMFFGRLAKDTFLNNFLDICMANLLPNKSYLYSKAKKLVLKIKKENNLEYLKIKDFLSSKHKEHTEKFFKISKRFYKSYNEMSLLIYYVRSNIDNLPDNHLVASVDFDEIVNLYGDEFEIMGDFLVLPAILNNVYDGRKFDEFKNMKLEKYLTLDKASKFDCILNNNNLVHFSFNLDPKIRNASHHGNIYLNKERDKIIYRHGKPLKQSEIEYREYIKLCIKIYIDLSVLYALESQIVDELIV